MAVYQRRRRDADFAAAMDQVTAARSTPEPASAATAAQFVALPPSTLPRAAPLPYTCEAITERSSASPGRAKRWDSLPL
ncbi:hypothetical protein [Streptomyces sp. NPDC059761]|uniref:hypothetical protein n=1 Tax=Streptomyces sp. NPDC059761 TaxID=3346937 RepID=UPI00365D5F94